MENRKFISLAILILLISYAVQAEGFVFPSFQGYVYDRESGKPIENAYVICFTDYYSFGQRFNIGGPNSHPDSMQIAQTDKNGFFVIEAYKKYSGGWTNYRQIFFFKEGYIYANQYLQIVEKKDVLRKKIESYRPSEEISLKSTVRIYLSNQEDRAIAEESIINAYLGLLYKTRYYYDYFKDNNKAEFEKLKPYFLELYKIFSKQSEDIIKTFHEPHLVENWTNDLKWFRGNLEDYHQQKEKE